MRTKHHLFLTMTISLFAVALTSCIGLLTDPAPADGIATHTFEGTQVSMVLPVSARGRKRPSPFPNWIIFGNELSDGHTIGATVLIGEKVPENQNDKEYLQFWMEGFERELPKGPGRQGAVLRSVERIERQRTHVPAIGAQCVEYLWVSEDRLVPGHQGEPYVMHSHEYVCIHPTAHVLIRSSFSERFPVKKSTLRSTFNDDAAFFFDNIKFD